jgi:pimeloyl-ACP methyl ester carboxylesterase
MEGAGEQRMSASMELAASRGRFVEIGKGRRLRAVPAGPAASPRPLVLLEAGSFGFSADWAAVQALLAAEDMRSLAYDRAGLGVSEPGPEPRDSRAIVDDFEALLMALGEPGPYVVVGHSMAGMHVRLFACRNAEKVRALVLVDATTPEAMDHPLAPHLVNQYAALSKLAAWGSNAGLAKPLVGALGDGIGLPADAKAEKRWAFADPGHNRWAAIEVAHWHADAQQSRAAGPLDPDWPVAVVLTGNPGRPMARHALQTAPAAASRAGVVIHIPRSNHASMIGERHASHIVGAILTVERAAANA